MTAPCPRTQQITSVLRQAGHARVEEVPGQPGEFTAGYLARLRDGVVLVTFWHDTRDPAGYEPGRVPERLTQAAAMREKYALAIRGAGWAVSEGWFMLTVTASDEGGMADEDRRRCA